MPNLTCSIDGCERKLSARGWCATHYMRWRKHGDVNANFAPKREVITACAAEGCERMSRGWHGWCGTHYSRVKKYGDPTVNKKATGRNICVIDGCEKFVDGHGLCSTHWARNKKHGSPHIVKPHRSGDNHPHWRGDEASYDAIHLRLRKMYGKAESHSCVDCQGPAYHWSYDLKDPEQRFYGKLPYSAKPEHYAPRCVPCHKLHDLHMSR